LPAEQIAIRPTRLFLAGAWADATNAGFFEATNPATGEVIGNVALGTREDAARAIEAAHRAAPAWGRTTPFERAAALERIAANIERRRDELARILTADQGKPLAAEANGEVDELLVYFRMAAADATRIEGLLPPSVDPAKRILVYRVPKGVVGVITPFAGYACSTPRMSVAVSTSRPTARSNTGSVLSKREIATVELYGASLRM